MNLFETEREKKRSTFSGWRQISGADTLEEMNVVAELLVGHSSDLEGILVEVRD